MQDVVYHVFVVVTGVITTLLTIGLSGIIALLVTDRGTVHAHPTTSA